MEIDYSEYMHWYYYGRHSVDDNNNNRQGRLSFEETFRPDRWDLRQAGFIFALCQVNGMLAYNFFNRNRSNKSLHSKGEFTQKLSQSLIFNDDNEDEDPNKTGYVRPATRGACELPIGAKFVKKDALVPIAHRLCKTDAYYGKWNGEKFPKITTR